MKNLFANFVLGSGLALGLMAHKSAAQNEIIDWYKVSGGAGTSTGGAYAVSSTSGQTDACAMSGGNYTLTGGFWSGAVQVQTAGGPTLLISYSGNNVVIQWQNQSGWRLQQNNDLGNPAGWTNSVGSVTVSGTNFHLLANPSGAMFFRLER